MSNPHANDWVLFLLILYHNSFRGQWFQLVIPNASRIIIAVLLLNLDICMWDWMEQCLSRREPRLLRDLTVPLWVPQSFQVQVNPDEIIHSSWHLSFGSFIHVEPSTQAGYNAGDWADSVEDIRFHLFAWKKCMNPRSKKVKTRIHKTCRLKWVLTRSRPSTFTSFSRAQTSSSCWAARQAAVAWTSLGQIGW